MTSVAELIKFLGTNTATYYRMLKANHADTADFRDKDGVFTDDGLKRLKAMLESPEGARVLLETLAAEQAKNAVLQQKIEADAPKVAFADAVEDKGGNLTLGDFAKLLYNDDTPTGRTRFIRWLRANGYFIQSAPLPYQQYIDLGWFLVRLKEIPNGDIVSVALITPKGQMALTNAFKQSHRIAG